MEKKDQAKERKMVWTLRRTDCLKDRIENSDITGFPTYEAALARMEKVAAEIGAPIVKDIDGSDIISVQGKGKDNYVLWWIYGTPADMENHKPQIL